MSVTAAVFFAGGLIFIILGAMSLAMSYGHKSEPRMYWLSFQLLLIGAAILISIKFL